MKLFVVVLFISAAAVVCAEDESHVQTELSSKLKEEFKFRAIAPNQNPPTSSVEGLKMKPFVVTRVFDQRPGSRSILEYSQRLNEEKFRLIEGGPVVTKKIGKVEAQIGFWPDEIGYQLIKFKW